MGVMMVAVVVGGGLDVWQYVAAPQECLGHFLDILQEVMAIEYCLDEIGLPWCK